MVKVTEIQCVRVSCSNTLHNMLEGWLDLKSNMDMMYHGNSMVCVVLYILEHFNKFNIFM